MVNGSDNQWEIIATRGDAFDDFAPYVPSLNNSGMVAFQVTYRDGRTGICTYHKGQLSELTSRPEGPLAFFNSHPDLNEQGEFCFYTAKSDDAGIESISMQSAQGLRTISSTGGALAHIGPLGPTMSRMGPPIVAFRATSDAGHQGIYIGTFEGITCVASTGDIFASFQGLPVIKAIHDESVAVVFRAEHRDGGQGIYLYEPNTSQRLTIAKKGPRFSHLANFPSLAVIDNTYHVAFAAITADGYPGAFVWSSDTRECHQWYGSSGPEQPFESIRGALLSGNGDLLIFATPTGGGLGIYTMHSDVPLLAVGDAFDHGIIASFALNPVSINDHGQIAARILLKDRRQYIATASLRP